MQTVFTNTKLLRWQQSVLQLLRSTGHMDRPASQYPAVRLGFLTLFAWLLIQAVFLAPDAQAQCSVNLKTTVSGCYQDASNSSKAWITVEVGWDNGPSNGTITVTMGGQTRTIRTGTYNVLYDTFGPYNGDQTIVSQQVVAFELPADGSTQTISAQFSSSCRATASVKLPAACIPTPCATGRLGGQVFKDFNSNGIKEATETIGLAGIAVTAYSADGTSVSGVSDVDGNYILNVPAAKYPVRVEFSALPTFAGQGSVIGTNTKSTVQFVTSAACNVNLGLLNPIDYCQPIPKIVVPCFVNGNPVAGSTSGDDPALVAFDYGTSGGKDPSKITVLAKASQIGSSWGTAYDRYKNRIFTSAVLKRHAGLGPLGLGGIYVTNMATNTTTNYIDVATLGINVGGSVSGNPWFGVTNTSRGLNSDLSKPSYDQPAFATVGKVGIGDLEIAEDGQALFFVNLFDKKLYKLNISGTTPTVAGSWAIPDPGCSGGVSRPFATKIYNGKVYVGTVCDASTSKDKSDLRAFIYTFDVTASTFATTPIFEFPLTYPKGPVQTNPEMIDNVGFYPWTDSFADINTKTIASTGQTRAVRPTPILTDIEIDIDGSIIIGLGDRTGMQSGFNNYDNNPSGGSKTLYTTFSGGDILRAQYSDGVYILENGGKLPGLTGAGVNNNQGIGFGEFYEDNFYNKNGKLNHAEVAFGGLALQPGSGEVIITAMDPVNVFDRQTTSPNLGGDTNTGGIRYLSNVTGIPGPGSSMGFVLYTGNDDPGTFGKSTGLGDLELTCALLDDIEIGNRVWIDTDGNGIQDPDESPKAGVTVQLLQGTTVIATATTDGSGNYVFSTRTATSTTAFRYGLALLPSTTYTVRIPNVQGASKQAVLAGISKPTLTKVTGGTQPTVRDSDGALVGNNADATVTTGILGQNNHTYDFGFTVCSTTVTAGADISICVGTGQVLSASATGGTAPYTYAWSPASGLSAANVANPTANPTATTNYTVTATDSFGCVATDVVRVTVNPVPVANAGADQALCGGSVVLAGSVTGGTAAYTYAWSPATGLSAANIAAPTANPTATTTYTLTVTDSKGCVDTDVVLVTVNPKPVVTVSTNKTLCAGTATPLSASVTGGTAAYTYAWLPATGLSAANVANPTATPTATTTYTVTVTDSKGCIGTGTVVITVTAVPTTPTAQSFSNTCPAATVSLASLITAGRELYTTNTPTGAPLTAAQVSNLTANATYYLFGVSNGCYSAPATIKVTIVNCGCTSNPISVAGTDRTVCANTVVALTGASVSGGVTQGQWSIVSGGGTLTNTGLTATPSSVSYTPAASTTSVTLRLTTADPDGTGPCTPATDDVVITFSSPAIAVGDYVVCAGNSVVLNASTSGGKAPYTYAWSPATGLSSTTLIAPTATPTATTTYTVVATDASGCKASDISIVTVNPKPVVNVGAALTICSGAGQTIGATVSGGTGPFTYAWSPASKLSDPAILNPVATPTATTTYTLTVTDSKGCIGTGVAIVTVNPLPVANAGSDAVACSGSSVTLTGSASAGTAPYSYAWSPIAGLSTATVANPVATPTATTTYTLTVTDSKGCKATDIAVITVNPAVVANAGLDAALCIGNSLMLNASATGGTSPYTYAWLPATGLSAANIAAPTATPTATTTYTLTVTDSKGCVDTDVVLVTVNPKPVVTASAGKTICEGASTVLSASVTGGTPTYTYAWLPATGLSAANVANPTASPIATTSYTVTATDSKGCSNKAVVLITVTALPTTPTAQSFSNVCPAATVSLASLITAGQELYTTNTRTGAPLTTAQVSSLTASATYYLFGVSNGCYSAPATIKVTVVNCGCTNNPTAIAGTDRTLCANTVVALSDASIGGGATQAQWSIVSGGGTLSNTAFTASPASVSYTPAASTTSVTLRLTTADPDGTGPCTPAIDEVVITFDKVVIAVGDYVVCAGSSVVLNASTSGGLAPYTYVWSPATGLSKTNIISPTATPTGTTTYTVIVTDDNGCKASDISVVTVNPKPVVNVGAALTICSGAGQTIGATVSGGTGPFTYAWSPASKLSDPAILNPVATPTATTSYTLTVTDSKGCIGTGVATVTVNPLPVANAGSDAVACAGSSVTLTGTASAGTAPYSYAWSPVAGLSTATVANPVATPTATTTYTLTVTDSKGCKSTDVALVTINPAPAVATGADQIICVGSSAMLSATVTGGLTPYKYAWLPATGLSAANIATPMANPTATTTYTLTVTDSKGCVGSDVVVVTVNPKPVVTVSANKTLCAGTSTPLSASVTGGTAAYTYAWLPTTGLSAANVANPTATPTATTTYTVTVTDSKGCTGTGTVVITVTAAPTTPTAQSFSNTCPAATVSLASLITAGQELYTTNTRTGAALTVAQVSSLTANGTYYLFGVSNGCYSAPATIRVNIVNCGCVNNPTANAGNERTLCAGTAVALTGASVGGGATQGQWSIVLGGGTLSNTGLTASPASVSYTPAASTTSVTLRLTTADPDGTGPCTPAIDEVVITFSSPTITVGDQSVCAGGSVVLNASTSGGTAPITYAWSPTTGLSSPTVIAPTATPTATTTYTVVATDANGCKASDVSVVTVNARPVVNAGADFSICTGVGQAISASVSAGTAPYTYAWSPVSRLSSSTILNPIATPTTATSYTLTVTDSKGCIGSDVVVVSAQTCTKPCALVGLTVTPGTCNTATNQYSISGTLSLTNAVAGTAVITDGTLSTTVLVTATSTSVPYSLSGLISGSGLHTVQATLTSCGTISQTYTAPASCSVALKASLGDYVWLDTNKNGVQDPTESGVPSVTVTLCDATSGTVISTTLTDGAGKYLFTNLNPGSYVVKFTAPAGMTFTIPNSTSATPATNSNVTSFTGNKGSTLPVSLSAGENDLTIDAGLIPVILPPSLTVVVSAPVCNTATNIYTATGTVSLTNVPTGATLTITDNGAVVSTTTLTAGQTTASFPVSGVSNAASHTVVATLTNSVTVSNSTTYNAPVSCTVCSLSITTTMLPNGQIGTAYNQTIQTSGGSGTLSFTVSSGALPTGLTLNTSTGVISGTPTAPAVTATFSVKVTDAKSCSAVTPLTIITSDLPVCSLTATATRTDCNTATNQYAVTGTVSATNTPANQSLTISVGSVNTVVTLTGNGPASYTLTGLNSDGQVKTVTVMSSATACGMTSVTYTAPASCSVALKASLGDYVWLDTNKNGVQDPTESGVPSVTVTLCDATSGTVISTTLTDGAGKYLFTNLNPGSYVVKFTAPAGTTFTIPNSTSATPATDSNVTSFTGNKGSTLPVSLSAGENNLTIDAGLTPVILPPSLTVVVSAPVCNTATNIYTATGTVSLTNVPTGATLTITDNGAVVSTTTLTAGQTTASFPVSGVSNAASHTVVATLTNSVTVSNSTTYNAPVSCSVATTIQASSATVCAGQTAILSVTGCTTGNITWSAGTTPSTGTLVTVSTAALSSITSQTVLSYTATCTIGSSTASAVARVTVSPLPSLTLTASPDELVTVGNSVTLTATGCTGGSVNWSTGQQNAPSVVVMAANTPGSAVYSATCITSSGCIDTKSIEIMTLAAACNLAVTAVPGACDPATNQYRVTGSVSATGSVGVTSVTVSSGSQTTVVSLNGNGPTSYTLSGLVSDGLVKTVSVVSSASVCGMSSRTYTAPMSCSTAPPGQPTFDIRKVVNTSKAKLGDVPAIPTLEAITR